jgi:hypothetical protein
MHWSKDLLTFPIWLLLLVLLRMVGQVSLLLLPDPCLVAVLRGCAADLRSLFSAARAHSRLHQAARLALSSITVKDAKQQQLQGLAQYLSVYGQSIDSLDLQGTGYDTVRLMQLPSNLQLDSLVLTNLRLQLQPGDGFQGVVHPGAPIKQLRLLGCTPLDFGEGLAAALAMLPELQHLCIVYGIGEFYGIASWLMIPTDALSGLQHLTHLELTATLQSPIQGGPVLQPLQSLTRLVDLRLALEEPTPIDSSILSGMKHLTRLHLGRYVEVKRGALDAQTQLLHLQLRLNGWSSRAEGAAQLLSQLGHLQQLTHLQYRSSLVVEGPPPVAAFSALTASNKLQYLEVSRGTLPLGVWHHVLPAGRQLPHLTSLNVANVSYTGDGYADAPAPEGTRLVSCCPGLQSLDMQNLKYSTEVLAPLHKLTGLRTLLLATQQEGGEGLETVGQLTGLRELRLDAPWSADGLLLKLRTLHHLTNVDFTGQLRGEPCVFRHVLDSQSAGRGHV